ncbi:MAG: hypothetical protein EOP02_00275 [Proteobacteria bacterium]|nr:MAG: hypothetical protein EOP02_00275 [Pseudomonadota bacterium]
MNDDTALWSTVSRALTQPMPIGSEMRSPIQVRRRRGFATERDDGREAVELVRDDGVLRWIWRPSEQQVHQGRRAWRSIGTDPANVVQRIEFPPIGRNRITDALVALDERLNPNRGLRRWDTAGWRPLRPGELESLHGRVLLLIHGTFSRSEMYDAELRSTDAGRKLFEFWTGGPDQNNGPYAAVLAFDHATLSESAWLNALALRQALEPLSAQMDIVSHSRGGLVVCWALRMGSLPVGQVIFVGSPLTGTSLASPARLREALDLLANFANAISVLAKGTGIAFPPAMPLAMGAAGLASVLGKALHIGAGLPIPDAVVGLVPGLMSQSRVENSIELSRLFPLPGATSFAGIGAQFKPNAVSQPIWKFWERFSNLTDQARYYGAEVIFGQPNDLVVDTSAMNQLGPTVSIALDDFLLLKDSTETHHCSYFRNPQAIQFLSSRLK